LTEAVVDEHTNATLSDFPVHCSYRTTGFYQPAFHSHNGYELYLCTRGSGHFIAGERIHALGAGTFTVVNPMAVHLSRPNRNEPFHRYVVAVRRGYLEGVSADDIASRSAIGRWLPEPGSDSIHFRLNARQLLSARETLTRLEGELEKRESCYPLIVRSLLLQLFAQLGRYGTESAEEQGGNDEQKRLAESILSYMMEHYQEPIGTEKLCGRFHLSRSSLFRIFKRNTGASVNEFLVSYRVNKAKERLQGTEQPITEVAAAVGFQDISHFCHTFKRLTGMTPSLYRSAHKPIATPLLPV
jgi:AraC-like DNA-binding protein